MRKREKDKQFDNLPACAVEFIRLVIKKMRYRKKVRRDVQAELAAHFEDELKGCASDKERDQKARQLIGEFGDAKLLAVLLRRAKKRCRPVWRTVVARTFQTIGVLILFFVLYTGWFLTGKPTISVDYVALFNQMNRPQVQDEDNAWPHYEKAITLFVKQDDELRKIVDTASGRPVFGSLANEEQQKIRKWVELNEAAWQEFVAASSKSCCYREYQYDPNIKDEDKWLFNVLLPHLNEIKGLAKLGIWRARVQIDANQPKQAIEDCLAIACCGSHWQGKGTLVEQLVGLGISRLACGEILNIVEAKSLSSADLKYLQQQLVQIYPQGYPLMNMEGERLCLMDAVQHLFTDGGPGGGHLVPHNMVYLGDITGSADEVRINIVRLPFYTAAAMVHAGRDETIARSNEIYDRMGKLARTSPYERHISDTNGIDSEISTLSKYRFFLIQMLMPAAGRASEIAYWGRASHQATVTVLALKQWRLEKNEYPANLDELVAAGYLKELPTDPYTDKPLVYKKTDDNFTLYSVGPNFKDDGGEAGKDRKGRVKKWSDNGDTVFWPVPDSSQ
jgi:competence protein ComGC